MKKAVAVFLMGLLLFPIFGKSWIIISFKLNQESIAKNLCVQRNIRNNSCHGCCQLKKRLAEKDKQEQKQLPRSSKEKNTQASDYLQNEIIPKADLTSLRECQVYNSDGLLPNASVDAVFHPPQI